MTRWPEIAGVLIVVALLLGSLYTAGYWWWVRPYGLAADGTDGVHVIYLFNETAQDRTLYYLYWPVIQAEGGAGVFVPEVEEPLLGYPPSWARP